MKTIAVAAVTAGGKTSVVNKIAEKLPKTAIINFNDYSFKGAVDDFYKWIKDGADYSVWDLSPFTVGLSFRVLP